MFLALVLLLQTGGVALAAEEVSQTGNPVRLANLAVLERFQDRGDLFFIPEQDYAASEKSTEKLYIPIQRAGDLDQEAQVVLKVTDLTARHDVNYKVELYREDVQPELVLEDKSVVDLMLNADGQTEYEPVNHYSMYKSSGTFTSTLS